MVTRLGVLGPDFDDFVREASTGLLRTATMLASDHASGEDLLQLALMRTARRWSSIRTDPTAYTRQVLVNLAKDGWRRRARRVIEVAAVGEDTAVPAATEDVLIRDELLTALHQLTARQRAVLVLRYFDDLSVTDTALTLRCSEGTVKSQTHRALTRMRELITAASRDSDHHAGADIDPALRRTHAY